jgi:N-acetyl sugar amidotransferase
MKICKRCVQPDTRPGIFFKDDICGACVWADEKKHIDWDARKKELFEVAQWAKKNAKGDYDCVIGVSGGKDSTRQSLVARDELKLHCLLVNYEPEGITPIGKHNIENLKNLGFDVISIRPNPRIMKKLMRFDFYDNLNPIKVTEFSLWASGYIIADQFNIPLIIQGENEGLTLGASMTGLGRDSNALNADKQNTLVGGWQAYLKCEGVTERDLYLFRYDRQSLEKKGTRGIWLQYYLKDWSQRNNAAFSQKYGFMVRDKDFDPYAIGTYVPFTQLDSDFVAVNQLLKYVKFGFGKCLDQACYDIREGTLTRKEAIEMVLKYDGKCSDVFIKQFCDYLEISVDEFWKTADKFRGPMWYKNTAGEWCNKYHDLLKQ